MKTKMIILTTVIGLAWNGYVNAQRGGGKLDEKKEQIKKERKDFINRWCGFTETEADKFWKIHDEMEEKMGSIRKDGRQSLKSVKSQGVENMSDDELKKAMDNQHTSEQKQLDLRWEYNQKFIDAVGVRKTARYYEGARMFKKQLMERMRNNRGGGMDGKDGGGGDGEGPGDE